jgi:hypothetical protein
MLDRIHPGINQHLVRAWQEKKFLPMPMARELAELDRGPESHDRTLDRIIAAFHSSAESLERLHDAAVAGDGDAVALLHHLGRSSSEPCFRVALEPKEFERLESVLWHHKTDYLSLDETYYPHQLGERRTGFRMDWIRRVLREAHGKLADFAAGRRSDTAVLVGNGPSLRKVDFSLFKGQDVFISNYAIKNIQLARLARGVAVSNPWVAAQEPYWFNLADCWKFFPFWNGDSVLHDGSSIFLNAVGGDLFFSCDVRERIAWHSTVSFFWLQILYSAGYRKVLLTGVDNQYQQSPGTKEGVLILQKSDDPNHFDPSYFKDRTWQAADTSKMEETYVLAKAYYEKNGREIVNCTVGGQLEVFRRADLAAELPQPVWRSNRRPSQTQSGLDEEWKANEESPVGGICQVEACSRPNRNDPARHEAQGPWRFRLHGDVASREFAALVEVQTLLACVLELGIAAEDPDGETHSTVRSTLGAGQRAWLAGKHTFTEDCACCRIDLREWDQPDKTPRFTVITIHIVETARSVFNRVHSNDGLLREANRLMREGQLASCLPLYIHLASIRPLGMYLDAARVALAQLGIREPDDQEWALGQLRS